MTRFEKSLLWVSTLAVGISGTVYAWMKFLLTSEDPYAVIHHPWQPAMLKAHILTAPFLVFALGLVFSRHVVARLKAGRRRGRRSGLITIALALPMVLSGYALQTFTSGGAVLGASWTHLVTGFVFLLGFAVHQTVTTLRDRGREARALCRGSESARRPAPPLAARGPVPEEE